MLFVRLVEAQLELALPRDHLNCQLAGLVPEEGMVHEKIVLQVASEPVPSSQLFPTSGLESLPSAFPKDLSSETQASLHTD